MRDGMATRIRSRANRHGRKTGDVSATFRNSIGGVPALKMASAAVVPGLGVVPGVCWGAPLRGHLGCLTPLVRGAPWLSLLAPWGAALPLFSGLGGLRPSGVFFGFEI